MPARPEAFVAEHPAGSSVLVYYRPDRPDQAVIEPGISGKNLIDLMGATIFCLVGGIVGSVALPVRKWRWKWRETGGVRVTFDTPVLLVRIPRFSPTFVAAVTALAAACLAMLASRVPSQHVKPYPAASDAIAGLTWVLVLAAGLSA